MAHMIETMAYAGETPWHGLGTKVSDNLSPAEMMKAAGLDWRVDKVPAYAKIGGKEVSVGWSALVRSSDNKHLATVPNDWNEVQNEEAFSFFKEWVDAGDMEMHTAGSLEDGKRVWALAKTKEKFEVFGGDLIEDYFLLSSPHKYGMSFDARSTKIRVVCNNTITMALNSESQAAVRLSHRRKIDIDEVKAMVGISKVKLTAYKDLATYLGGKRATPDNIVQYFKDVFPLGTRDEEKKAQKMSRAATQALGVLDTQPGAEFARGTWWPVFNAVTYVVDHELGRSPDSRLSSAWFGYNRARKVKALERAVEYAEAA
jgi:phage/plasmid-like protein (TIGR03299 family)